MKYLLYLKKSFICRPRRHITLYLILTCAFMLPLFISIYRDSFSYGQEQCLLERSKGQTFHISNASQEYLRYFENIPGMSAPFYEDNTIYLRILSKDEWKSREIVNSYGFEISNRISAIDDKSLVVRAFDYDSAHGISTDPADITGQKALFVFNLFIILLSVFVIQSAYKSHLKHFAPDIGTLTACGADHHQIRIIFIVEFLLIFFLAAMSSTVISICIMKLLFWSFLEVRNVPGLAWLVFHVSPENTALYILFFFLTMAVMLGYTLWRTSKETAWALIHSSNPAVQIKIRDKELTMLSSPERTLSRLWHRRTNRVLVNCIFISVPVMIVFLFLFSYLMLNISFTTETAEYEITVSKDPLYDGFSLEDITYVQNISGVKCVQMERQDIWSGEYMMKTSADNSGNFEGNVPVSILPTEDLTFELTADLKENDIIVSNIQDGPAIQIGDRMLLYRSDSPVDASEEDGKTEHVGDEIELTVVDIWSIDSADIWDIAIYVSDELYQELMDAEPVGVIGIALDNPDMHSQVEYDLRRRFSGAEYELMNRQLQIDFVEEKSTGIYLLLAYLFGILFLFVIIILYVKLCDYIENNRSNIRALYIIGASKQDLYRSFMRQAFFTASIAAIMPIIVCEVLTILTAMSLNIPAVVNGTVFAVYLGVGGLIVCSYLCPIHRTLKNILRKM